MTGTGDLNAAIEKQAGEPPLKDMLGTKVDAERQGEVPSVSVLVESEPAALVPEGVPQQETWPRWEDTEDFKHATAEALAQHERDKASAMEAYITAGVAKTTASLGGAEIVTVSAFKAAVEALLRHLHADHPENYL